MVFTTYIKYVVTWQNLFIELSIEIVCYKAKPSQALTGKSAGSRFYVGTC